MHDKIILFDVELLVPKKKKNTMRAGYTEQSIKQQWSYVTCTILHNF